MNKDILTVSAALTIVICAIVISISTYNINDRNNMAKNIESAITKGVDPVSVKCAYETGYNAVCITYAASQKK